MRDLSSPTLIGRLGLFTVVRTCAHTHAHTCFTMVYTHTFVSPCGLDLYLTPTQLGIKAC